MHHRLFAIGAARRTRVREPNGRSLASSSTGPGRAGRRLLTVVLPHSLRFDPSVRDPHGEPRTARGLTSASGMSTTRQLSRQLALKVRSAQTFRTKQHGAECAPDKISGQQPLVLLSLLLHPLHTPAPTTFRGRSNTHTTRFGSPRAPLP